MQITMFLEKEFSFTHRIEFIFSWFIFVCIFNAFPFERETKLSQQYEIANI